MESARLTRADTQVRSTHRRSGNVRPNHGEPGTARPPRGRTLCRMPAGLDRSNRRAGLYGLVCGTSVTLRIVYILEVGGQPVSPARGSV